MVSRINYSDKKILSILAHPAGDPPQELVALGVAVGVVDQLEAVQIDIDQQARLVVAGGQRKRALQLALETAPVQQAGQFVGHRQLFELGDPFPKFDDTAFGVGGGGQRPIGGASVRSDLDRIGPGPNAQAFDQLRHARNQLVLADGGLQSRPE